MSLFSQRAPIRSLALAVALALVGAGLLATPVQGQEEGQSSQVVAQVDYMKAEPDDVGEYLSLEREIWKPIHQERVNDGELLGWSLYRVRYPAGTGHDYNYVTVTFYESRADVENLELGTYAGRAHPDKNVDVLSERTNDAREWVRSELWTRVDRLVPEDPQSGPAPFLQVDYMKVEPGGGSDYVSLEQEVFKPVHRARLDAGMMDGISKPRKEEKTKAFLKPGDIKKILRAIDAHRKMREREPGSTPQDEWDEGDHSRCGRHCPERLRGRGAPEPPVGRR